MWEAYEYDSILSFYSFDVDNLMNICIGSSNWVLRMQIGWIRVDSKSTLIQSNFISNLRFFCTAPNPKMTWPSCRLHMLCCSSHLWRHHRIFQVLVLSTIYKHPFTSFSLLLLSRTHAVFCSPTSGTIMVTILLPFMMGMALWDTFLNQMAVGVSLLRVLCCESDESFTFINLRN